jgi:hypothetical protein
MHSSNVNSKWWKWPHGHVTVVTYAAWSVLGTSLPNFSTVQHRSYRDAQGLSSHRVVLKFTFSYKQQLALIDKLHV